MNQKIFFNRCFDKKRLKNFILWFFYKYGEKKSTQLIENFKNLGFKYATYAGISIGIDDLEIPSIKSKLIGNAEQNLKITEFNFKRGYLTDVEKCQQMIDEWSRISGTLKENVIKFFELTDIFNPIYMMAFSGARGNISQVRQLVGMRGLMADPEGQIIDFPIRSNFREGLTLTEYIISCYGARKGIVDTALRTATSGYLTRRLVDVSQHIIIGKKDCQTKRGINFTNLVQENQILLPLEKRLLGRILLNKVNDEEKKYIGFKDQEITYRLATQLAIVAKNTKKDILLRSPMTCASKNTICQLCYGWNLSRGALVSLGEAVGVLAAQSIGEPGTQLTMRTFHTGGVFTGNLIDQIYAPFDCTILYPQAFQGILIRTLHGRIGFLTKTLGHLKVKKRMKSITIDSAFFKNLKKITLSFQLLKIKKHLVKALVNRVKYIEYNLQSNNRLTSSSLTFKIPSHSIIFARQGSFTKSKQLLAELTSFSFTNQQQESEQEIKSKVSGQIHFHDLTLIEKEKRDGVISKMSFGLGSIWVIEFKAPPKLKGSLFFPNNGDLIESYTTVQKFKLIVGNRFFLEDRRSFKREEIQSFLVRNTGVKKNSGSIFNNLIFQRTIFQISIQKIYFQLFGYSILVNDYNFSNQKKEKFILHSLKNCFFSKIIEKTILTTKTRNTFSLIRIPINISSRDNIKKFDKQNFIISNSLREGDKLASAFYFFFNNSRKSKIQIINKKINYYNSNFFLKTKLQFYVFWLIYTEDLFFQFNQILQKPAPVNAYWFFYLTNNVKTIELKSYLEFPNKLWDKSLKGRTIKECLDFYEIRNRPFEFINLNYFYKIEQLKIYGLNIYQPNFSSSTVSPFNFCFNSFHFNRQGLMKQSKFKASIFAKDRPKIANLSYLGEIKKRNKLNQKWIRFNFSQRSSFILFFNNFVKQERNNRIDLLNCNEKLNTVLKGSFPIAATLISEHFFINFYKSSNKINRIQPQVGYKTLFRLFLYITPKFYLKKNLLKFKSSNYLASFWLYNHFNYLFINSKQRYKKLSREWIYFPIDKQKFKYNNLLSLGNNLIDKISFGNSSIFLDYLALNLIQFKVIFKANFLDFQKFQHFKNQKSKYYYTFSQPTNLIIFRQTLFTNQNTKTFKTKLYNKIFVDKFFFKLLTLNIPYKYNSELIKKSVISARLLKILILKPWDQLKLKNKSFNKAVFFELIKLNIVSKRKINNLNFSLFLNNYLPLYQQSKKKFNPKKYCKFKNIFYKNILLSKFHQFKFLVTKNLNLSLLYKLDLPYFNLKYDSFPNKFKIFSHKFNPFFCNYFVLFKFFLKNDFSEIVNRTNSKKNNNPLCLKNQNLVTLELKRNCKIPFQFFDIGHFVNYGDKISPSFVSPASGRVIYVDKLKLIIQKSQPFLITNRAILNVYDKEIINKGDRIFTSLYNQLKTGDIVQGIPRIEEFFEARSFRDRFPIFNNVHFQLRSTFDKNVIKFPLLKATQISFEYIQKYIVDEVQKVYCTQGVYIADKHLEVVVRQMTSKVQITDGGQSGLLAGEIVDFSWVIFIIENFKSNKLMYEPIVLGITKSCLETESFISAASFQETTRILSKAAIQSKVDFVRGLKQNVILGSLIPAGTGFFLLV